MAWPILITVALAAVGAALGGPLVGLLVLVTIGWLLLTFRPLEAGAMVAAWSRKRFE